MEIQMHMAGDVFHGPPKKEGDKGCVTAALQTRLNTLSRTYCAILPLTVDGKFGPRTKRALQSFQALFGLEVDGILGEKSWNALSEVYHLLLASAPPPVSPLPPENCWQTGDRGMRIGALQFQLNALRPLLPELPLLQTDGIFGGRMKESVRLFQAAAGLFTDGVVCPATFDAVQKAYLAVYAGQRPDFLRPLSTQNAAEDSTPSHQKEICPPENSPEEESVMQTPCLEQFAVIPYPGAPIGPGAEGETVRQIQRWINALLPVYAPLSSLQEDGIYGSGTAAQVRLFQQMFALSADGVVGSATWSMLQSVCAAAKEGRPMAMTPNCPAQLLRAGSAGSGVKILQEMLSVVHTGYPDVPAVQVDGIFGRKTEDAVLAFQKKFCLNEDGIVGCVTWTKLVAVYTEVYAGTVPDPDVYPGTPLHVGSQGASVLKFQNWLNALVPLYSPMISLKADGIFGGKTEEQVRTFQRMFALSADGVAGEKSWNALRSLQQLLPQTPPVLTGFYGGVLLQRGSFSRDVRILQYLLNEAKALHDALPLLTVDGSFGPATEQAVRIFQNMEGLVSDGKAGLLTWNRAIACQPRKF